MKLKLVDKINIIAMLEVGHSQPSLAKKYNIGLTAIVSIVRQYREHEIQSLKPKGKNAKHRPDFKLQIVQRVLSGESKRWIATKREKITVVYESRHKYALNRMLALFKRAVSKLYLSPILDMHNREIVSYTLSRSPNFKQIIDMLNIALKKHKNLKGLIFHSDQGWQYQMKQYRDKLESKGIRQSMSRKGNCYDNCVMENFFGIMKNEMFYGNEYQFETLDQLEQSLVEYIKYYNNQSIITKLKGLMPIMYRLNWVCQVDSPK